MGIQISQYELQRNRTEGLLKPIIYCTTNEELENKAIPLNTRLARELLKLTPARRSLKMQFIVDSVLAELPEGCLIKDFDVLFSTAYKIDVLKILYFACKKKNFSILWPGTYQDGKLYYAEEGYKDYKIYDIEKYDVTCIV